VRSAASRPGKWNLGSSGSATTVPRSGFSDRLESFAGATSDTSILPIAQPYPFRADRFLGFPDLSLRARWNDAGVAHQRPAAFLDFLVNLVEDGFSRRCRLFVLLLRERTGSLLEVIACFTHQLIFRFRRWERGTDRGAECNA